MRNFMKCVCATVVAGAVCMAAEEKPTPPSGSPTAEGTLKEGQEMKKEILVGAIRWDAWHGDLGIWGQIMQKTLLPEKYHWRLPYFATFKEDGTLSLSHVTQAEIDEEIEYAKRAGLDYFAFCTYERGTPLAIAWDKYLASTIADKPKWCVILGTSVFPKDEDLEWMCREFEKPHYQRVAGGRPLVYVFEFKPEYTIIQRVRDACEKYGVANPYIVVMGWDGAPLSKAGLDRGADATSAYCRGGSNGESYAAQCANEQAMWKEHGAHGLKVLPWVTTGWDPRPRVDTPVPWTTYAENFWAQIGTAEEIAAQVKCAIEYAEREGCEANAVIIYAWNEYDEGGWLLPTLHELEKEGGPTRIEALGGLLRK